VLILAAAIPTVLILGMKFLSHLPLVGTSQQWCGELVGVHDDVPAWLGLSAIAVIVAGTIRSSNDSRASCTSGFGRTYGGGECGMILRAN